MSTGYTPLVKLKDIEDRRAPGETWPAGDRRDGKFYRYSDAIRLRVNLALATGRPLLVLGPSGCGKSSLAFSLARRMGRRYYEYVVTSRSEARELFYRFDAVRRLGDAHLAARPDGAALQPYQAYLEPGPLWWIFAPASAARRAWPAGGDLPFDAAEDPAVFVPEHDAVAPAVLLIDEIDKAEPDYPNNLLVPLGSRQFAIAEVAAQVAFADTIEPPLVVVTSNQERDLPEAFVRRCVVLEISAPSPDDLVATAQAVKRTTDTEPYRTIAQKLVAVCGEANLNTAEYLDAVQAVERLHVDPQGELLEQLLLSTAWRADGR